MYSPKSYIKSVLVLTMLMFCHLSLADGHGHSKTMIQGIPISHATETEMLQIKAGMAAIENGRLTAARKIFTNLLDNNEKLVIAYIGLMQSANNAEDFFSAVRGALKVDGITDAERMIVDINHSYMEGNATKRIKLSEKLVEKFPESYRAWVIRGNTLQDQDRVEDSRNAFYKAMKLTNTNTDAFTFAANSYMFFEPKNFDKAQKIMAMAVDNAPANASSFILIGDIHRAKNELKNAVNNYELASYLAPDNAVAHMKRGHANTFLGNYDEARDDYAMAGEVAMPGEPVSYGNYAAFTHLYEGNPEKSHEALEAWLTKLDKHDMSKEDRIQAKQFTLNNMAMIAIHHSLDDKAEKDLNKLGELIVQQMGNVKAETFNRYVESNLTYLKGLKAVKSGDTEKAKVLAKQMWDTMDPIDDESKHEQYHLLMGLVAVKDNDFEEAVNHLNKSDQTDIYAKYHKAIAYQRMDDKQTANQLLSELKEFNFNQIDYALIRADAIASINR